MAVIPEILSNIDTERRASKVRNELVRLSYSARTDALKIRGGGGFAARRSERLFSRFLKASFVLVFLIPVLLGGIYYFGIASRQYVTESYISLSSQNSGVRAALSGLLGSESSEHAAEVMEYLRSANAVIDVDADLGLARLFSRPEIDWLSRLPVDAAIEEKVKYWRHHLDLEKKAFTSQIRVRVRAFSPEDALALHDSVLQLAETHVNAISGRQHDRRIKEAQNSVDRARNAHREATEAMRKAREEHRMLDPAVTAKGYQTILGKLRENAATLERRIETARAQAQNSPQIQRLEPQLEVVRSQIEEYQNLIASPGTENAGSIASTAANFDSREIDVEIARSELATRMAMLEAATAQATEQAIFMQRSVEPTLPQKSTYPRRWLSFSVILIAATALWLLVAGFGLLVRDNMT